MDLDDASREGEDGAVAAAKSMAGGSVIACSKRAGPSHAASRRYYGQGKLCGSRGIKSRRFVIWKDMPFCRTALDALFFVVIVAAYASTCYASIVNVDHVSKGFTASDMNWVDNSGQQFLQSQSGNFIASFDNTGNENKFYLTVMLNGPNVIVWAANRNRPVEKVDSLVFGQDGNVQLLSTQGPVWSTGTNGTDAQILQLQDTGNLVVKDSKNSTLWQSFDHPTDTLMVGQQLRPGMQLVSSKSTSDFSEGPYSLRLGDESLELVVDLGGGQRHVPYWVMANDSRLVLESNSPPAYASLDLQRVNLYSNDSLPLASIVFPQSVSDNSSTRLLVLQPDGKLNSVVYSSGVASPSFLFILQCQLPSSCGPYGICSSDGQCDCPSSLVPVNTLDDSQGCRVTPLNLCKTVTDVEFQDLDSDLFYFANQYVGSVTVKTLEDCKQLCRLNCSCNSGFFKPSSNSCYLSQSQRLGSFELKAGSGFQTFIRVPVQGRQSFLVYVIIACSLALILVAIGVFVWWYRRRKAAADELDEEDGFLEALPGLPMRFTYKQLQTATNGFSKKLGRGGFGSVYEGGLPDKSMIAVKQLESIVQGKKEFRAEVATIGSIHHVNLVRLRGFCSEGTHRLLVYEFLSGGSLDKSLFSENSSSVVLDWDTRYSIALGTARGLAYLHEDCRERIIHCDIKPENILLDEHFTAKVSDFGLAKLMNREQSHVFTTLRGTRGYLAPEWLLNYAISEKSDVYSFGMVLLEIVSGRKNFDPTETSEKWYIPAYAFKQAEVGGLLDLLDSKIRDSANEEQVLNAVKIALWCIQEEVQLRPSTGKVVKMLEGNISVPDPPLSSQFAVRLHARLVDAVSEKDRYSIGTEYNSQDLLSASCLSGPR